MNVGSYVGKSSMGVFQYPIHPVIEKRLGRREVVPYNNVLDADTLSSVNRSGEILHVAHDKNIPSGAKNRNYGVNAQSLKFENHRVNDNMEDFYSLRNVPAKFTNTTIRVAPSTVHEGASSYIPHIQADEDAERHLIKETNIRACSNIEYIHETPSDYNGSVDIRLITPTNTSMVSGKDGFKNTIIGDKIVHLKEDTSFNPSASAGYEYIYKIPVHRETEYEYEFKGGGPKVSVAAPKTSYKKDISVPVVEFYGDAKIQTGVSTSKKYHSTRIDGQIDDLTTKLQTSISSTKNMRGASESHSNYDNGYKFNDRHKNYSVAAPKGSHDNTDNGNGRHLLTRNGIIANNTIKSVICPEGDRKNIRLVPQVSFKKSRLNNIKPLKSNSQYVV